MEQPPFAKKNNNTPMPCSLPIKAAANILKVIGDVAVPSQEVKSVKKRARLPLGSRSNVKLSYSDGKFRRI